jgi:hypothetical protein
MRRLEVQEELEHLFKYCLDSESSTGHLEIEMRFNDLIFQEFQDLETLIIDHFGKNKTCTTSLDIIFENDDNRTRKERLIFSDKQTIQKIANENDFFPFIPKSDVFQELLPIFTDNQFSIPLKSLDGVRAGAKLEIDLNLSHAQILSCISKGRRRTFRLKERTRYPLKNGCFIDFTKVKQCITQPSGLLSARASYNVEIEWSCQEENHDHDYPSFEAMSEITILCVQGIRMKIDFLTPCSDDEKRLFDAYCAERDRYFHGITAAHTFYKSNSLLSPKLAAALLDPCRGNLCEYTITLKFDGINANLFIQHEITEYYDNENNEIKTYSKTTLCIVFHRMNSLKVYPLLTLTGDPFELNRGSIILNGEWMPSVHVFIPFDLYVYGAGYPGLCIASHKQRLELWTKSARNSFLSFLTLVPESTRKELERLIVVKPFIEDVESFVFGLKEEEQNEMARKIVSWLTLTPDPLDGSLALLSCASDGYILTPKWETPDFTNPVAWMQNYKVKLPKLMTVDIAVRFIRKEQSENEFKTVFNPLTSREEYICHIIPSIVSERNHNDRIDYIYISPQEKKHFGIYDSSVIECSLSISSTGFPSLKILRSRDDKIKGNQERTLGEIYDYIRLTPESISLSSLPIFAPIYPKPLHRYYCSDHAPGAKKSPSKKPVQNYQLQKDHSFIKWSLISHLIDGYKNVLDAGPVTWLDVGAGRGGDIHKWATFAKALPRGRCLHVIALEPSQSIEEGIARYRDVMKEREVEYNQLYVTWVKKSFEEFVNDYEYADAERFDIITFMHSIHYLYTNHPLIDYMNPARGQTDRLAYIRDILITKLLKSSSSSSPRYILVMSMDAQMCNDMFVSCADEESNRHACLLEQARQNWDMFKADNPSYMRHLSGEQVCETRRPIVLKHEEDGVSVIKVWRQSERQWLVKLESVSEPIPEVLFSTEEVRNVFEREGGEVSIYPFSIDPISFSSLYFYAIIHLK